MNAKVKAEGLTFFFKRYFLYQKTLTIFCITLSEDQIIQNNHIEFLWRDKSGMQ